MIVFFLLLILYFTLSNRNVSYAAVLWYPYTLVIKDAVQYKTLIWLKCSRADWLTIIHMALLFYGFQTKLQDNFGGPYYQWQWVFWPLLCLRFPNINFNIVVQDAFHMPLSLAFMQQSWLWCGCISHPIHHL